MSADRQALLQERIRARTAGIPRRDDPAGAPLSVSQRQIWYLNQLAPESAAYNEVVVVTKRGPFDPQALRCAFGDFLRRHEAWRTTFTVVDGVPRQVIADDLDIEIPYLDLSRLSAEDAAQRAAQAAAQDVQRPYDLARGPLIRPRMVRISADEHRLYLAIHHILFDGVTLARVFLPELVALYDARVAGRPAGLPPPAVQYPDYAEWEGRWVDGPAVQKRLAWWRDYLADAPTTELPLDFPRPHRAGYLGGVATVEIDAATVEKLTALARECNATLFQVLFAVYAWWSAEFSGSRDVLLATVADLRRRADLERMAGYCLAPVLLRADVSGSPSFAELVGRVREGLLDVLDQVVPFEPLVRTLGRPREAGTNPLFQSVFILEPRAEDVPGGWSLRQLEPDVSGVFIGAKLDCELTLEALPEGLHGRLVYDTELFSGGTAAQMMRHFAQLATLVARSPHQPLDTLPEATIEVLDVPPAPTALLPDLFRAQVRRSPDAVAVTGPDGQLTYAELDFRARAVARLLADHGTGPGSVVGISLDRSVELVVGLLGVLLAGAAYVPLDPQLPLDRLEFMAQDAGAQLLLTTDARHAPDLGLPVLSLRDAAEPLLDEPALLPSDLAYVMHTSGSTGRPKGVQIDHGNLAYLLTRFFPTLGITSADTVVNVAAYTFDVSVSDIFSALITGCRLVISSAEQRTDPQALARLLDDCGATVLQATPTMFAEMLRSGWAGRPELAAVPGGEMVSESLARALAERCRTVWNVYGPTEITVWATAGRLTGDGPVHVGMPLPGTAGYVLDESGRPVAPGVPGEVVISSPGVARGYANRPDETQKRFADDPFRPGSRAYRTGDRGRLLEDGTLRILGRTDDQLKYRGFRIEPGEIEAVLTEHPGVDGAAVLVRPGLSGEPLLVAHVVGAAGAIDEREIRTHARNRLPEHMVPNLVVPVASLPKTSSGKLDRKALRAVPLPRTVGTQAGRGPGTGTEQRLVAIWSELLGVPVNDVDADFYDLGGHSLLAARMVGRVRQEFGTQMALADFIARGRTVAGLANLIDGAGEERRERTVFFVYPDLTNAFSARHWNDLGTLVHPLIPLYRRGRIYRRGGVQRIAARMVAEIKQVQPDGPYAVGGYSFGGTVAYEIARQLREQGDQLEWLGILDSPTGPFVERTLREIPKIRLARQLARRPRDQLAKLAEIGRRNARRQLRNLRASAATVDDMDFQGALRLTIAYDQPALEVPVDLFVTDESVTSYGDKTIGWSDAHGGPLRIIEVPGGHLDMLLPPHVDQVMRALVDSLQEARRAA